MHITNYTWARKDQNYASDVGGIRVESQKADSINNQQVVDPLEARFGVS